MIDRYQELGEDLLGARGTGGATAPTSGCSSHRDGAKADGNRRAEAQPRNAAHPCKATAHRRRDSTGPCARTSTSTSTGRRLSSRCTGFRCGVCNRRLGVSRHSCDRHRKGKRGTEDSLHGLARRHVVLKNIYGMILAEPPCRKATTTQSARAGGTSRLPPLPPRGGASQWDLWERRKPRS